MILKPPGRLWQNGDTQRILVIHDSGRATVSLHISSLLVLEALAFQEESVHRSFGLPASGIPLISELTTIELPRSEKPVGLKQAARQMSQPFVLF